MTSFKNKFSFEKRRSEVQRILKKYPNRIPIVVEIAENSSLPPLDKSKYLVPEELTISQFIYIIRKRLKLQPDQALFIFVNNCLLTSTSLMKEVYKEHKEESGFLMIIIREESTFGM